MAKKKASKSGINMSQEIRDSLTEKPTLSAKEVHAELQKRHPGLKFNENSLGVAFSAARKKLGLAKSRKKLKKAAAGKKVARKIRRATAAATVSGDISQLQAARDFIARCGSAEEAVAVIRQLESLQI